VSVNVMIAQNDCRIYICVCWPALQRGFLPLIPILLLLFKSNLTGDDVTVQVEDPKVYDDRSMVVMHMYYRLGF
jgi:hypothetical protein